MDWRLRSSRLRSFPSYLVEVLHLNGKALMPGQRTSVPRLRMAVVRTVALAYGSNSTALRGSQLQQKPTDSRRCTVSCSQCNGWSNYRDVADL